MSPAGVSLQFRITGVWMPTFKGNNFSPNCGFSYNNKQNKVLDRVMTPHFLLRLFNNTQTLTKIEIALFSCRQSSLRRKTRTKKKI